jgi:hypothetical protein
MAGGFVGGAASDYVASKGYGEAAQVAAGTLAGAATGAAIGSIVPSVGTAAGAIIGGRRRGRRVHQVVLEVTVAGLLPGFLPTGENALAATALGRGGVAAMTGFDDPAFYGDRWADVYDERHGGLDPAHAVEFLAGLADDGPVLELAIGTGRVVLPPAARGMWSC